MYINLINYFLLIISFDIHTQLYVSPSLIYYLIYIYFILCTFILYIFGQYNFCSGLGSGPGSHHHIPLQVSASSMAEHRCKA